MTDRKPTCVACKSAITEGDIAHKDLEFGGELKATNQPEYTGEIDTDVIATIGTLDEYTPMVRTTGNQNIAGNKTFTGNTYYRNRFEIAQVNPWFHFKNEAHTIGTAPASTVGEDIRMEDNNGSVMARMLHYINPEGDGTLRLALTNLTGENSAALELKVRNSDGKAALIFYAPSGASTTIINWTA